jgi:hypothetical protein
VFVDSSPADVLSALLCVGINVMQQLLHVQQNSTHCATANSYYPTYDSRHRTDSSSSSSSNKYRLWQQLSSCSAVHVSLALQL